MRFQSGSHTDKKYEEESDHKQRNKPKQRTTRPFPRFFPNAFRFFTHKFYVAKISARSLRGDGTNTLNRSASASSRAPSSCANINFCCFSSAIISGDGGKVFSA